jgi:hypothetical protein
MPSCPSLVTNSHLFTRYVRDLLKAVNSSCIGCSIGGIFVNIFAYADDMVLLAPCWSALQELIILLESICHEFDLVCNTKKTVCMMFSPKDSSKRVALTFPAFSLGSQTLQFVSQFRYLGHIILLMIGLLMMMTLCEKLGICSLEPTC